jgi:hypothetical protein
MKLDWTQINGRPRFAVMSRSLWRPTRVPFLGDTRKNLHSSQATIVYSVLITDVIMWLCLPDSLSSAESSVDEYDQFENCCHRCHRICCRIFVSVHYGASS